MYKMSSTEVTMFDDELMTPFKKLSIEEIYLWLDTKIDNILFEYDEIKDAHDVYPFKSICMIHNGQMLSYLGELYRRGIQTCVKWWDYDYLCCIYCKKSFEINEQRSADPSCIRCSERRKKTLLTKEQCEYMHIKLSVDRFWENLIHLSPFIKEELRCLRKVKLITLVSIKIPILTKEINIRMAEILDATGQDKSIFEQYLLPEHYSNLLEDYDVSEWGIDDQETLLDSLKKIVIQ